MVKCQEYKREGGHGTPSVTVMKATCCLLVWVLASLGGAAEEATVWGNFSTVIVSVFTVV